MKVQEMVKFLRYQAARLGAFEASEIRKFDVIANHLEQSQAATEQHDLRIKIETLRWAIQQVDMHSNTDTSYLEAKVFGLEAELK